MWIAKKRELFIKEEVLKKRRERCLLKIQKLDKEIEECQNQIETCKDETLVEFLKWLEDKEKFLWYEENKQNLIDKGF